MLLFKLLLFLRLLSVFSLAPKEIHEKYKNEILSIVKLSKELSVDNTWNKFLSTLLETILNDDTNGIDNGLLQQEIQTILTTTTNNDSNTEEDKQLMMKFNISFLPKQFMYMETNELPTFILDSISNKDEEEKHFIPRPKPSMNASTNNNEDVIREGSSTSTSSTTTSGTKRKMVEKAKIERYDPLSDPNNNHKNKQPRLIKPPIFSVEPSSTTNNNNNNNNNTEPPPKPLQPHFCEQIELIIKNADRAVFLPRREEIVRAFMKNPKDINYAKKILIFAKIAVFFFFCKILQFF